MTESDSLTTTLKPVEIWASVPEHDNQNHREAAKHARNGLSVLVHDHCHTATCKAPGDPGHRHGDCDGARHWRSDGATMKEELT